MKSFACLCLVFTACMSSYDDQYPIAPGAPGGTGGTAGGTGGGDGTGSSGDTTGDLTPMSVCLASDVTTPTTGCEHLEGLQVQLGNQTATTDASGSFEMVAPTTPGQVFHVTGTIEGDTVNTLAPVTQSMVDSALAGNLVVPSARASTVNNLFTSAPVPVNLAAGQLFLNAASANGQGIEEIEAASDQSSAQLLYEQGSLWTGQSTGVTGTVWLANATVGQVALTLSKTGSNPLTVSNLPIQAGATTFVTTRFQ